MPQEDPALPISGGQTATTVNWIELFSAFNGNAPPAVTAETFVKRWTTASQAVTLSCSDGNNYVVKGLREDANQGRMAFNDQVAARLATLIGAPVPTVALVDVPAELIALNPRPADQMGHMRPGIAHGSLMIDGVSERIDSLDHPQENRERFARSAVFFGWMGANDRQFIFKNVAPFEVFSHDHGHFFPNGPDWTIAALNGAAQAAVEHGLVTSLSLTAAELKPICDLLGDISPTKIAEILAIPPPEWGVGLDDRVALADFLNKRRDQLSKLYAN